jgi:hypothetical protein
MAFQGFKSCSGRITGSHADVLITLSKRIPGWSYKKEKDSRDKDKESREGGGRRGEYSRGQVNQPAADSQISLRRYLLCACVCEFFIVCVTICILVLQFVCACVSFDRVSTDFSFLLYSSLQSKLSSLFIYHSILPFSSFSHHL